MVASVQRASNQTGGGQPNLTVTLGAGTTAGNLLVAFVTTDTGVAITMPDGWTVIGSATTSGTMTGQFYTWENCPSGMTATLIQAGGSGASITGTVWEFSGLPAQGLLFDSGGSGGATGSGTALSTTGGTLAQSVELVLGGFASNNAVNTITAGGGFTDSSGTNSASTAANHSARMAYVVSAATTAQTAAATSSTSSAWLAMVLTIRSTAAGSAGDGGHVIASAGTFSDGAGRPASSRLIYATGSGVWWAFWVASGSQTTLRSAHSTDLSSWTTGATTTLSGSVVRGADLAAAYVDVGSTDVVQVTYRVGAADDAVRGTLTASAVTWGSSVAVMASGGNPAAVGITPAAAFDGGATLHVVTDPGLGNFGLVDATHADAGTSWTSGFNSATTVATVGNVIRASAVLSLGAAAAIAIADNGDGVSAGTTTAQLKYSTLASGVWAAAGSVFAASLSPVIDVNDWHAVARTSTDVHVAARTGSTSYKHRRWNGSSWSDGDAIPALASKPGGGLFLVSDGTSVWLFAIALDSVNSVQYSTWQSGSGWSAWTVFEDSTQFRSGLTGAPVVVSGTAAVAWTQLSGSSYDIVVESLVVTVAPAAAGTVTLQSPSVTAGEASVATAAGSVTLASPSVAAQAAYQTAAGAVTLSSPAVAATSLPIFSAAGAVTLESVAVAAQGAALSAAGAVTLSTPALAAAVIFSAPRLAAGAIVLSDIRAAGAASYLTSAGAVALTSPTVGVVAALHLGPPTITSVSPAIGGQLTQVTILGTNLANVTDVIFGPYHYFGYPFSFLITIVSNTELRVFAPDPFYLSTANLDNVTVDVSVVNIDGTATVVGAYTIVAPPVITSITPTVMVASSGDALFTLTGKNFQTAFALFFGSQVVSAPLLVSDDGSTLQFGISTVLAAALGTGTYAVTLWNASGNSVIHNPTIAIIAGANYSAGPLDDVLSGRYGPPVVHFRFERRTRAFVFIEDLTDAVMAEGGCTIDLDNDQLVSRTAEFSLIGPNLPADFTGTIASQEGIAVWCDVTALGLVQSFALGLFHLDEPANEQYPLGYWEVKAKGSDMTIVPASRTTTAPYTVPKGSFYVNYVADLCTQLGLRQNLGVALNWTTPVDFTWPAKTPLIQVMNDLLLGVNYYPVWADGEGVLQSGPRVDPALNPPNVRYSSKEEPRLIRSDVPSTVSRPQTTIANYVTVAIDDPARDPYNNAFTNADPSSPASTTATGRDEALQITGSGTPSGKCLLDGPTADAVAAYELQEEATRAVIRSLSTVIDPRRTNREYYQLALDTVGNYENETLWRVQKWSLACETGGTMTHELGSAAAVAISTGAPPLTTIVRQIAAGAFADAAPLDPGVGIVTTYQPIPVGDTLVFAVMADAPPTTVTDPLGNVYTLLAAPAPRFGVSGSHPVADAGLFGLYLYAGMVSTQIPFVTDFTIGLGANTYLFAAAVWQLRSLVGATLDTAIAYTSVSATSNSLAAIDSGLTGKAASPADFVVGAVGGVWLTTDVVSRHTFRPDTGQGWPSGDAQALEFPVVGGIACALFLTVQIAGSQQGYRLSGIFDSQAAAAGALVAALPGQVVS